MRNSLILLVFLWGSMGLLKAQSGVTPTEENARVAIQSGSSRELVKLFGEQTELKHALVENRSDQSNRYSKPQAEAVMRYFFQKYPPKSFNYLHVSEASGGLLRYAIGTYEGGGKRFRVLIVLKKDGDNYRINTLDFTEE